MLLLPSTHAARARRGPAPVALVGVVDSRTGAEALAGLVDASGAPWVAWDRSGDREVSLTAYRLGAAAVVPASDDAEPLRRVLDTLAGATAITRPGTEGRSHYRRGDRIALSEHDVLTVVEGVVSLTVLHEDGSEVLLGLSGPDDLVIGHPEDRCCLHLTAHTDVGVDVLTWDDAIARGAFAGRVRARLRSMEAWAAAQARPHLEQRLLGILDLLAERFGRPAGSLTAIDVRLTHGQLASAIGTTRPTVTRLLASLKRRRLVATRGRGPDERLCLTRHDRSHHHG